VQGEEREVLLIKETSPESVKKFVGSESLPLIVPFNTANTDAIFSTDISRHLLLIAPSKVLKPDSALIKVFRDAATKYRAKREFVFVTVANDDEEGAPVVEFFGAEPGAPPTLFGFQVQPAQKKYKCVLAMLRASMGHA
jgi:hypothetical protein